VRISAANRFVMDVMHAREDKRFDPLLRAAR